MVDFSNDGDAKPLGLLLHHDAAGREVAYDRNSRFGRLDRGLDSAAQNGWSQVFSASTANT